MLQLFVAINIECFLQHVVNNMLDSDERPKEILQSGFDLLAELIKFNIEAFKIIDDVLRTPEMVISSTILRIAAVPDSITNI